MANGRLTCVGKELDLTKLWWNLFFSIIPPTCIKTSQQLHHIKKWFSMEGIFKLHLFLPCSRESNISASCLLAVDRSLHRNNDEFLNQLNLTRFEFYVSLMTLWRKFLRETKLKVEDTKNHFSGRFYKVKQRWMEWTGNKLQKYLWFKKRQDPGMNSL